MVGFSYVLFSLVSLAGGIAALLLARQGILSSSANGYLRLAGAVGVLGFAALNVVGYYRWKQEGLRVESLHRSGVKISADITQLEQDRSVAVNHQFPYRILCVWTDPRTGSTYHFRSAQIFHDPNFELRDKKSIVVYLDSADYSNYDVDLSSVGIEP